MDTIQKETFKFHWYPFIEPFLYVLGSFELWLSQSLSEKLRRGVDQKAPGVGKTAAGAGIPNQAKKSFH